MLAAFVQWTGVALELTVLVGLVARRRLDHLFLLPVLLAVVAVSTAVPLASPHIRTWPFWVLREFTHATLALVMGVELAVRLFFRLPTAQRLARLWILAVVGAVLLLLLTAPEAPLMTGLLPRLVFALVCLYAGLAIVAFVHLVPVDPLHNVVLRGFALYMAVYGLAWALTSDDTRAVSYVNAAAFDVLMLVLAWAAWRRHDVPAHLPRRTVAYFWPWRRDRRDAPSRRVRPAQPGWGAVLTPPYVA